MVFDCFTFFNELDLLEFRLRLLSDVVDKFVICESNLTFSGNTKPYNFQDNRERFKEWEDRIIYLPVEQDKEGMTFEKVSKYSPNNGPFLLEYQQRNSLIYASELMKDDDIVLMGDLDEIPDPRAITGLRQSGIIINGINNAVSFPMLFHYYYMNCQMEGYDRIWNGTIACFADYFKEAGPQHLRNIRNNFTQIPAIAGYHFSYLGGPDKVKTKIESFAHTELNRPDITSDDNIINAINNGQDIFKRNGLSYKVVPVSEYPEPIRSLMLEYPQFIKNEVTIPNL
jgi:beta-1,4-mannosyl-glycoprotein beta-1,4-N-acetylglucosaminyltransferase